MIEILDVTKRYGRRAALDGVSLRINAGEVTLLLGANGAGKSTLLRCLLGVEGFEGSIRLAGLDPLADGQAVRSLVGYMPQSGGLHLELTVQQTIDFYAGIRRVAASRGQALLREAQLADAAAARVGDLSGGMRQRLGFVLALLSDPQILVLDEPSASLDTTSREWLADRLRELARAGRTVLVSTHAGQELLGAGHRRVVLEDGRVIEDYPVARNSVAPNVVASGSTASVASGSSRKSGLLQRAIVGAAGCFRLKAEAKRTTGNNSNKPRGGSVVPIIRKELTDAISSRWLIGYAVLLGALGLAATATGLDSTSGLALQAFGRTTATLMNLCLLLAPLVAVLMGAASIAGERERGTLEHLLAQPLSRRQLLLGKHAGLLAALTAATVAGFLPAGLMIAASVSPDLLAHYLLFPAIASLAGASMAAVGLLISVSSRSAVQSQGSAVFAWFAFVLLYDLVLMGSLALNGMPVEWLSVSLALNPIDAARVLGVLALEPDLYMLGPAGAYLSSTLSRGGAAGILLLALVVWAVLPVTIAALRFGSLGSRPLWRSRPATIASPASVSVPLPINGPRGPMPSPKEVTLS